MNKFDVGESVKIVGELYLGDIIIVGISATKSIGIMYKLSQHYIFKESLCRGALGWFSEDRLIKNHKRKK